LTMCRAHLRVTMQFSRYVSDAVPPPRRNGPRRADPWRLNSVPMSGLPSPRAPCGCDGSSDNEPGRRRFCSRAVPAVALRSPWRLRERSRRAPTPKGRRSVAWPDPAGHAVLRGPRSGIAAGGPPRGDDSRVVASP